MFVFALISKIPLDLVLSMYWRQIICVYLNIRNKSKFCTVLCLINIIVINIYHSFLYNLVKARDTRIKFGEG